MHQNMLQPEELSRHPSLPSKLRPPPPPPPFSSQLDFPGYHRNGSGLGLKFQHLSQKEHSATRRTTVLFGGGDGGGGGGECRRSHLGFKEEEGEGSSGGLLKVRDASRPDMSARPMSMAMKAITVVEELDQILEEAQELSYVVIIDWVAAWCRKCIYLKPKLEKLAAEYYPRNEFFHGLDSIRQKMPTIQLWKDKEWKEEVIGGHKPWLVIDEVREMIQKHT